MTTQSDTLAKMGLTVTSEFIAFSKSRNANEKHPSLNWKVTLRKDGRAILTTDYSAGAAHCPAYKASVREMGGRDSIMRDAAIRFECESGFAAVAFDNANSPNGYQVRQLNAKGKSLQPNALDVIASLVMDSSVLDESSFEDWASSLGYDVDSRKAETMYRACLDIALKLRNGIGESGLSELREAFRDY
jgi:hypothetical protein